jgi:hypothetical protein
MNDTCPPLRRRLPALALGLLCITASGAPEKAPVDRISEKDRQYWFFQPLASPNAPEVKDAGGWAKNDIDRFILARQEAHGISPSPSADARTLIRRAYFDLTGLPPTAEQIADFSEAHAADPDAAFDDLVDELLKSPQYGERWGRIWLDLVRYGESNGYKADEYRPHMWRYRDWVIRALNSDMPYDQFVKWQLAGDELEPDQPDAITATGYLRLWPYESNQRNAPSQWNIILEDITDITGHALMGLSLGCAKCHDHKFDPLLQDDYFRMQAFFASIYPNDTVAATAEEQAAYQAALTKWESATAAIRAEMDSLLEPLRKNALAGAVKVFAPELQAIYHKPEAERTPLDRQVVMLIQRQADMATEKVDTKLKDDAKKRYAELQAQLKTFDPLKPAPLPAVYSVTDLSPATPVARIFDAPERTFQPGFLTILDPSPASLPPAEKRPAHSSGSRIALAEWMTRPDNAITTRVIVNRLWQNHFGLGIVPNANDFGKQGTPPTHPELLDWLARRFVADGWSLKKMHKLMMTSATWRQSAIAPPGPGAEKQDPENSLLWRQRIRRLEAEQVRDATLAAGGDIDLKMGGEGISGETTTRRSIYQRLMKNSRTLFLNTFDGPDGFNSCALRDVTTTAPQALVMLNNRFLSQRAERIATLAAAEKSDDAGIDRAFNLALGRQPNGEEVSQARDFLSAIRDELANGKPEAAPAKPAPKVQTTAFKPFPATPVTAGNALNIQPDSLFEKVEVVKAPRHEGDTFTVETVINLDSYYPDAAVRTIAARWTDSGDLSAVNHGWSLGITSEKSKYQPGNLIMQITGQDTAGNPRYEVLVSDLRIPKQVPYYVAAVIETGASKDGGNVIFYAKDLSDPAAKVQTVVVPHAFTGQISRPDRKLYLGGRESATHQFDGMIARFRLTDRALPAEQLIIGAKPAADPIIEGLFSDQTLSDRFVRAEPAGGASKETRKADPRLASLVDLSLALLNSNEFLYID